VSIVRPTWSTWSFLVYAGGLTFALAVFGWLGWLVSTSGRAGDVGWALLLFAVLVAIADGLRRTRHPLAAGVFSFGAVAEGVVALALLFVWLGWNARTAEVIHGLHPVLLLLEAAWAALAVAALWRYRFPLLVSQLALAAWLLVTDLLSNGGDWSALVSLLVGLVYLGVAVRLDAGERRPYGFWLHVAAGLAIGGAALYTLRHSTFDWVLVAVASLAYVLLARQLERSSWAVLGTFGLFVVASHFTLRWARLGALLVVPGHTGRPWVPPLVFSGLGALLVALGLAVSRPRAAG
jgi:hypothetical protein